MRTPGCLRRSGAAGHELEQQETHDHGDERAAPGDRRRGGETETEEDHAPQREPVEREQPAGPEVSLEQKEVRTAVTAIVVAVAPFGATHELISRQGSAGGASGPLELKIEFPLCTYSSK